MKTNSYDPALLLDSDAAITLAVEAAMNDDDPRVLPVILRHVAEARGLSVAALAEAAGVNRESLYKTLKGTTDARWTTIHALLKALNIRLTVAA